MPLLRIVLLLSCLVLEPRVLSCLVLSCLVLSCLVVGQVFNAGQVDDCYKCYSSVASAILSRRSGWKITTF
eukprot:COSAG06_NODE_1549_length_9130_cov_6.206289_11_plen_70_part_01